MPVNESLAKGLAQRIIRNMELKVNNNFPSNDSGSYRKKLRRLVSFCNESNWNTVIGEKLPNTKNWELAWGEWSINQRENKSTGKYTKCCTFKVVIIQPKLTPTYFDIMLSKHALIRMIMRSNQKLENSYDLRLFMNSRIKEIAIASMSLMEQFIENESSELSEEGWTIINDEFYPLSLQYFNAGEGVGRIGFVLKTFMKDDYESVKKTKDKSKPLNTQKYFFIFSKFFHRITTDLKSYI